MKRKRVWILSLVLLYLIIINGLTSCISFRLSENKEADYFGDLKKKVHHHSISIEGQHIHYVYTGKPVKGTILFVHGSPGSWADYKLYFKDTSFTSEYQVIAIDRPGFGNSHF